MERDSFGFCKGQTYHTQVAVFLTNRSNLWKPSVRFGVVKPSCPKLYNAATHFAVDKTHYHNYCKPTTRISEYTNGRNDLRVDKTPCPTALRRSKHTPKLLCGNNKRTLGTTASHEYILRCSKLTLRTWTSLLNALSWSKRTLPVSASLQHALRWSKRIIRASTSPLHNFWVVKPDSTSKYNSPTHFAVVKIDLSNTYKHFTLFVVIKTHSPNHC